MGGVSSTGGSQSGNIMGGACLGGGANHARVHEGQQPGVILLHGLQTLEHGCHMGLAQ